jgi:hypothetical protein
MYTHACPCACLYKSVVCCAGGVLIAGNLNVPLVWLVASVVAWMFTSASCVAVMEKLPWHDALYFVGSTLTTVGYGDVVVKSSMGEWTTRPTDTCCTNPVRRPMPLL